MAMVSADLAVRNAAELCTMQGPEHGKGEAVLGSIAAGSVACREGRIVWAGPDRTLSAEVEMLPGARVVDASGCVVTPGLIDCHTHLIFAGERADEFASRCEGVSYLAIAERGGGIGATVRATRAASEDDLVRLALPRLRRLLSFGVTTAEAKSGYGLSLSDELKMLRAIARLPALQPIEIVPTLLCAHAVPAEHARSRGAYVDLCVQEIIPEAAKAGLARFCDAFVEQGAFSLEEGRRILRKGKELGLAPRLHADQLSALGAVELAAELGAATADHLESISPRGIEALAESGVSAVLLPTSTLFLKQTRFAPGRALWDAGLNVGLATNLNPGSAMTENAALSLSLACLCNGLSPAEALWAFTRGSARALGLGDRLGAIASGMQADLVVHACANHRHLAYHLAMAHVETVIKRGRVVLERGPGSCRCVEVP
jgi:imidazolonepropionase